MLVIMEIIVYFLGFIFYYTYSSLVLLLLGLVFLFNLHWRLLLWFSAAFFLAFGHQFWLKNYQISDELMFNKARIVGTITSVPIIRHQSISFEFLINKLNEVPRTSKVLLTCYHHCPTLKIGEKWEFLVKLKHPLEQGNPGTFNYKQHLDTRHIYWIGYLLNSGKLINKSSDMTILALRNSLAQSLYFKQINDNTLAFVQALTLGISAGITPAQWDLFRRTGTTHLVIISGSHIALIATLVYWLTVRLWSLSHRLCLFKPAVQVASLFGLIAAIGYALLAGLSIPTQRSLIACIFLLLPHFLHFRFTAWQSWRYALFVIMTLEPHAVLIPGFYLSFLAVALLIATNQRFQSKGIKKVLLLQVACLLGLIPFTLFWFSYGSINGFLANIVAIPLIGYIIVPLALISLCLIQWFHWPFLLFPVNFFIQALFQYLQFIDRLSIINLHWTPPTILTSVALFLAFALFFLTPNKMLIPSAIILSIASFFPTYLRPEEGNARMDVLDVGQGLAIVVSTKHHTLVYDTGGKFYEGRDMGERVIIPYLNSIGITKLDKIIISHPDLDHRGGLASLQKQFPNAELIVNDTQYYQKSINCHHYSAWQWDDIHFRFLPITRKFRKKNDTSCILQVLNNHGRILLTGDIERQAEEYLIKHYTHDLHSTILVVPHHGSKTSSSRKFIATVSPEYGIISAGFNNRYHFPHQKTLETLRYNQTSVVNTAFCGMVSVDLNKQSLHTYRPC